MPRVARWTHPTACLATTGDLVILSDIKWPNNNDGIVDAYSVTSCHWELFCDGVVIETSPCTT